MSHDEIKAQPYIFDEISYNLYSGDEVENGKKLLKELANTRFSTRSPTYHLMPIVGEITDSSSIKKWLVNEPKIRSVSC